MIDEIAHREAARHHRLLMARNPDDYVGAAMAKGRVPNWQSRVIGGLIRRHAASLSWVELLTCSDWMIVFVGARDEAVVNAVVEEFHTREFPPTL